MLKKNFFVGATLIFGMAMFNACGSDSGTSAEDNEIPASSDTEFSSSSQVTEGFSSSLKTEVSSSSLNAESSSQGSATNAGKSSSSTETAMSSEKTDEPTSSSDSSPSESVSSSSKQTAGISSAAVEGAYRSAQRAEYFTENGQNYYRYFRKYCEVDNGTYTLKEETYPRIYAYAIANDTLKTFYADDDLTFRENYADVYTGKNNDIFGTWDKSSCRISEGAMKCSELGNVEASEFLQDSIVSYMMVKKDFDYMEKQGQAYEFLLEIFDEKFYRETESQDRYTIENVPSYGITFSNKTNNSITATIQGQVVDFTYSEWSEPDRLMAEGSVTSNGKTCSRKSTYFYITKETCSADFSYGLKSDGSREDTENHFTTTRFLDQGDVEAYNNCIEEMFKGNPIWDLLKN